MVADRRGTGQRCPLGLARPTLIRLR